MRSDSGNCMTEKLLSWFCYISWNTQQLYCMDFSQDEPERICNMFLLCHAGRKITNTILLHIWSTQQLYCMDFSLGEQERICNMFLLCLAWRKNHYHDFVTYHEALGNCNAWTSAWMNKKGYVTCSYCVTHDGKITIMILLHILKHSATVLHGLKPGWTRKNM